MKFDRIEKIEIGTIALIIIIVFAFLVNNPNPDFELQIVDFSLDETNERLRVIQTNSPFSLYHLF